MPAKVILDTNTNFYRDWNPDRINLHFMGEWIDALKRGESEQAVEILTVAPLKSSVQMVRTDRWNEVYAVRYRGREYRKLEQIPAGAVCDRPAHCAIGLALDIYEGMHPEHLRSYWENATNSAGNAKAKKVYVWRGPKVVCDLGEQPGITSDFDEQFPEAMRRYLGIPQSFCDAIVEKNDRQHKTFPSIASYVFNAMLAGIPKLPNDWMVQHEP